MSPCRGILFYNRDKSSSFTLFAIPVRDVQTSSAYFFPIPSLIIETEKSQASNPNRHGKPSQRQQRLQEVSSQLEQGVREVFSSEKYQNYLKTMAKFHRYSFRNSLLIAMQKPDASYVASFTAWRTKFHRKVNKGGQGIKILCPMTFKKEQDMGIQKAKRISLPSRK